MFAKMHLSTKFTLLLSAVCLIGVLTSGVALWQALTWKAQNEVTDKALILIETMRSVRGYTDEHINPVLEADGHTNRTSFIAESVPAFSARIVFDQFRQKEQYQQFNYKEASLNPTNPNDQADSFESQLIKAMRNDRGIDETSGFRILDGQRFFYIARPLAITSRSCLDCHSTPAAAPAQLIKLYGPNHGFGWTFNDVNSTQIIYVPAQALFDAAFRSFVLVMSIFGVSLIILIFLINVLLRRFVLQPVRDMAELAQKIKNDELLATDVESGTMVKLAARADEVGALAQTFRDMAHEVISRTQALKQQVQQLRIEIDEQKHQADLATIVDSDSFKDLQAKARSMRQRRYNATPPAEE